MTSEQTSELGWQTPNAALSRKHWYWNLKEGKMMPYFTSTPMSEEEKRVIDPLQEPSGFDTMQGNSTIPGSGYQARVGDLTSYESKDMTLEKGMEGEGAGLSMAGRVESAGRALKRHHG